MQESRTMKGLQEPALHPQGAPNRILASHARFFRPKLKTLAAAFATVSAIIMSACALADDVEPKALPDRIEDVPATRPDPFPAFDNFSWRAFIALAWPAQTDAAHRGEPDRSKMLGDPGPRVWETFKSRYELFQRGPNGQALPPAKWGSYDGKNPCGHNVDSRTKTLNSFNTFADFNEASFTLGKFANPLVAQNRTYTRYEVRINEAEFNSIVEHKWYIRSHLPTSRKPGRFNVGSIAVKAAWRILTEADTDAVRRRYYVVRDAEVVDVAGSLATGTTVCSKRDIALVGLHIVVKTEYRPQGIWSSFEHIDNVPPIGTGDAREPDARDAHAPCSYNDASKKQSELAPPMETQLAQPVGAGVPPQLDPDPMQVIRQHPINSKTMAMNRVYWALPEIRNTVWANYMLVVSQWPTVTQPSGPQNDGRYFPGASVEPNTPVDIYQLPDSNTEPNQNLANTTMETYYQSAPASCMACHHTVSNALGRDFVAFMAFDANDPLAGRARTPAKRLQSHRLLKPRLDRPM